MPIVAMPDGAQVSFPDDMPADQIRGMILQKFPDAGKTASAEPPRERQNEYVRGLSENLDAIKKGLLPSGQGERGQFERLMDTGKGVLAVPNLVFEATGIPALWRAGVGTGLAEVENAGRRFSGMPADPEGAYERGRGDAMTALSAVGSRGVPASAAPIVEAPSAGRQVVDAAQRLSSVAGDVNVPRAIASDSVAVQRVGQGIRNVPIVGDAIPKATARLTDDLGNAVRSVADQYGSGSGPNVASRIGRRLDADASAETAAATNAARASDDALLADWQRSQDDAMRAIGEREAQTLDRARAAVGDMSPQDMGEALIARLRQGERAARAEKERLYGVAGSSDGAIRADAARGLRADVENALHAAGDVIDPALTPAASRMMAELDRAPLELSSNMGRRPVPPSPEPAPRPFEQRVAATPSEAQAPRGESLLEFLASKGGISPDAELGAIGADGHVVSVTGVGRRRLVKQGGLTLDYAREAAEEAGYLRGSHGGTATPRDLLDAIDAEMRGQKQYAQGFEGSVSKREAAAQAERGRYDYDRFRHGLEQDLAEAGHTRLAPDVKDRALKLMESERLDANSAVKRAFQESEQEDAAVRKNFPGGQLPPDPAVSMQAMEQTRKRLNALSRAATNDADRRAATRVMRAYDKWLDDAFDNALFSGSDHALNAYRAARQANSEWRQRFGYNARDDADRLINRIATGEVTPQEVSNWLVGASQVGGKGVSSRLLTRIAEATGGDAEAMAAIRGGVWNRLSQATEGATARAPEKVASGIYEFLHGPGRDVARRLFTPEQQGIMGAYADTIRGGQQARQMVGEIAKNTKPSPSEVGPGPMQELASSILGKGGKSDEALFGAIDAYAKSGGRGDIQTLARIVRAIPAQDKGDLAGSIIRNLGVSPRTGQFSPDVFVSQWKTYTPQAKAILFGNAGPQRQALDDIMIISDRLKQVGQKFGNPSGTAQNTNILAAIGGAIAAPLTTLTTAVGGAVAARILAAPAGASSAAKWSKAYQSLVLSPSPRTMIAFQTASNNLANTSQALGAKVTGFDFVRALQSPAQVRSDEQQSRVPRPPGQ